MREDAFSFGVLDRANGISETVLKDKMINVHSLTRILETLKPTEPPPGQILTTGLDSESGRPLQILNGDLACPHRPYGVIRQVG